MSKRYILIKCDGAGARDPIDSFAAHDVDEAEDALKWLRAHHPERSELRLGPGEFFEILDEERSSPDEWRNATERLREKRFRREAAGKGANAANNAARQGETP